MKFFRKPQDQFISQVVILSMIFGLAGGIVGQIVADVYIDPWRDSYINSSLITNTNVAIIPELNRVTRFLGIEQDFEVNKSIVKISPSVIGIYQKKPAGSSQLNQIYLPNDLKASGFILTSDGWLVSLGSIFNSNNPSSLVVVYNNQSYEIEQFIEDATTGLVFIKISANNLPVVILGDSDELVLGQLALVLNSLNEAVVANIKSTSYYDIASGGDFVSSSEEYTASLLLTDSINQTHLGSPVVNLAGEVVGIIKEINSTEDIIKAVPINQFRSVILDVLRSSLIKRSYLGVNYLDLSKVIGLNQDLTQGQPRGALVYQNPVSTSPAGQVGIRANDIIVSVDGQVIDHSNNLTALVQKYKPGDEVNLEIIRNGQTISRDVTLAILPE